MRSQSTPCPRTSSMCISLEEASNNPSFQQAARVMDLPVEEVYRIHMGIVSLKQEKNAQAHAEESGAALRLSRKQPRCRISSTDEYIIASVPPRSSTCEAVRLLACYMMGRPIRNIREYKAKAKVLLQIIDKIDFDHNPMIQEFLREVRQYFGLETAPSRPSTDSAECEAAAQ